MSFLQERSHYSPCCAQVDDRSVMCFQVVAGVQVSGLLIAIVVAHNLPVFIAVGQYTIGPRKRYIVLAHLHRREEFGLLGVDPRIYRP